MDRNRYFELQYFCAQYPMLDDREKKLIKSCVRACHPDYQDGVFRLATGWPDDKKRWSDIFVENYKKFLNELDRRKGSYDRG